MKQYIFNEKQEIEGIIKNNLVDSNNITKTIKKLARYNYYVLGKTSDENYEDISEYMNKNCSYYTEVGYYNVINNCIKDVAKGNWKNIDKIFITQDELNSITKINDLRYEKLAFVMLADAKYNNTYKGGHNNCSYLSMGDLFNLARVSMPIKERAQFIHYFYANGLIIFDLNPTSNTKQLTYVSDNNNNIVMELDYNNYKELAFTYLNWKKGGYKRCKECGVLFKPRGNMQYCKICSPKHIPLGDDKVITCIDCGTPVVVSPFDAKTCRCDKCQSNSLKNSWKLASQKYRNSKKSS